MHLLGYKRTLASQPLKRKQLRLKMLATSLIWSMLSLMTSAHMLMKTPLTRGYKGNPSYSPIDYDLNGPLPRLVSHIMNAL